MTDVTIKTVRYFAGASVTIICFMTMWQVIVPSDAYIGVTTLAIAMVSGFAGALVALLMRSVDEE